jgi:hypothetical protein
MLYLCPDARVTRMQPSLSVDMLAIRVSYDIPHHYTALSFHIIAQCDLLCAIMIGNIFNKKKQLVASPNVGEGCVAPRRRTSEDTTAGVKLEGATSPA